MFRVAVPHPTQALLAPEGSTWPASWCPGFGAPRPRVECSRGRRLVSIQSVHHTWTSVFVPETAADAARSRLFPITSRTPVNWLCVFYSLLPYVCGGGVTRVCVRSHGLVCELSGGQQRPSPLTVSFPSMACALAGGHQEQDSPLPSN